MRCSYKWILADHWTIKLGRLANVQLQEYENQTVETYAARRRFYGKENIFYLLRMIVKIAYTLH